jgi:hypothetical protein
MVNFEITWGIGTVLGAAKHYTGKMIGTAQSTDEACHKALDECLKQEFSRDDGPVKITLEVWR